MTSLSATFDTRREAEMSVERLVQEFGIDRSAIQVAAAGDENSAGEEQAGSDTRAGGPSPEDRDDSPLQGAIMVLVEVADEDAVAKVRDAFHEFGAADLKNTGASN